jgi:hypothetical protein
MVKPEDDVESAKDPQIRRMTTTSPLKRTVRDHCCIFRVLSLLIKVTRRSTHNVSGTA